MPFRERVKRALTSRSQKSPSTSPTASSSLSTSPSHHNGTTTSSTHPSHNTYQPGEPMPKPKYRAPVKKEHREKLESFQWATAWSRRKSGQSEYSPHGSRMPSRKNSAQGQGQGGRRSGVGRRSFMQERVDVEDVVEEGESGAGSRGEGMGAGVGVGGKKGVRSPETAEDHELFTVDDLNLALSRSRLGLPDGKA